MSATKKVPRTKPTPGIRHPVPAQKCKRHFAAFGFVENVVQVFGLLRHETTGESFAGGTIHPPSEDTGFWVIHFVRDDFPHGDGDTYTLEVYDADDLSDGPIQTVSGLSFLGPVYDSVLVTYPQGDTPVGSEFAAYGTAPGSLNVSGKCSGCTYQIMQGSPGPDWVLYCFVSAPNPPVDCTLTVSQQGASDGTGTFEIPKT